MMAHVLGLWLHGPSRTFSWLARASSDCVLCDIRVYHPVYSSISASALSVASDPLCRPHVPDPKILSPHFPSTRSTVGVADRLPHRREARIASFWFDIDRAAQSSQLSIEEQAVLSRPTFDRTLDQRGDDSRGRRLSAAGGSEDVVCAVRSVATCRPEDRNGTRISSSGGRQGRTSEAKASRDRRSLHEMWRDLVVELGSDAMRCCQWLSEAAGRCLAARSDRCASHVGNQLRETEGMGPIRQGFTKRGCRRSRKEQSHARMASAQVSGRAWHVFGHEACGVGHVECVVRRASRASTGVPCGFE